MKTKTITIAGKLVNLAYCYATEIGFCDITETSIANIDTTNPKHVIALIMAAFLAYYEGKKEECPIKASEIMYNADPSEITDAFIAVMELRLAWYKLPTGEPTDETPEEKAEGSEKNA